MPKVIRISDEAQSHGYSPLCSPSEGSTNVLTNNIGTVRVGDLYSPSTHKKGSISHPVGNATLGSNNVIVNGSNIHRDGDYIGCGTVADNGSPNVFANSKDGSYSDPDIGGDTIDDTGGFAIGPPVVSYDIVIIGKDPQGTGFSDTGPRYVDVLPNGEFSTGYTIIYGEVGGATYKNYDGIGLVGDIPEVLPPEVTAPIDLTYQASGITGPGTSAAGLTLDPDTGRLYGCPIGATQINIRAIHYAFDDPEQFEVVGGTASAWYPVRLSWGTSNTNELC